MPILNEKFYENLDKKIDTIPTKEEAEEYIQQAFQPIIDQLQSLMDKVVNPLLAQLKGYIGEASAITQLLDYPTDPMQIIPWVEATVAAFLARIELMKVLIQPYLLEYNAATEIINGFPSEIATLQTHFEEKMQEKGWDVSVPTITMPTLPPLPEIPPILLDQQGG